MGNSVIASGNSIEVLLTSATHIECASWYEEVVEKCDLVRIDVGGNGRQAAAIVDGHCAYFSRLLSRVRAPDGCFVMRIGIIGFGGAGQAHYFYFACIAGCRVTKIFDPKPAAAERATVRA